METNRRMAFLGAIVGPGEHRIWSDDGVSKPFLITSTTYYPIASIIIARLYRPDSSHPISTVRHASRRQVSAGMGCATTVGRYVNGDNYVRNDGGAAGAISTLAAGNEGVVIKHGKRATPLSTTELMLNTKGASCMTLPILFDEQLGFSDGEGGMTRCPQARPAPPGNGEKAESDKTRRREPTKRLNMYAVNWASAYTYPYLIFKKKINK